MPKYDYPFLECDEHEGPQLGRVVCRHILGGAVPEYVDAPTKENVGAALCPQCAGLGTAYWEENYEELELVCEQHYRSMVVS